MVPGLTVTAVYWGRYTGFVRESRLVEPVNRLLNNIARDYESLDYSGSCDRDVEEDRFQIYLEDEWAE